MFISSILRVVTCSLFAYVFEGGQAKRWEAGEKLFLLSCGEWSNFNTVNYLILFIRLLFSSIGPELNLSRFGDWEYPSELLDVAGKCVLKEPLVNFHKLLLS